VLALDAFIMYCVTLIKTEGDSLVVITRTYINFRIKDASK